MEKKNRLVSKTIKEATSPNNITETFAHAIREGTATVNDYIDFCLFICNIAYKSVTKRAGRYGDTIQDERRKIYRKDRVAEMAQRRIQTMRQYRGMEAVENLIQFGSHIVFDSNGKMKTVIDDAQARRDVLAKLEENANSNDDVAVCWCALSEMLNPFGNNIKDSFFTETVKEVTNVRATNIYTLEDEYFTVQTKGKVNETTRLWQLVNAVRQNIERDRGYYGTNAADVTMDAETLTEALHVMQIALSPVQTVMAELLMTNTSNPRNPSISNDIGSKAVSAIVGRHQDKASFRQQKKRIALKLIQSGVVTPYWGRGYKTLKDENGKDVKDDNGKPVRVSCRVRYYKLAK